MLLPTLLVSLVSFGESASDVERLPHAVLYAGNEGTAYTESWRRLLEPRVKALKVIPLADLEVDDLEGIDVLVIGGEVESKDAKGNLALKRERQTIRFESLQGFPVVLMGGQGGFVSDDWKLKTSWQHG